MGATEGLWQGLLLSVSQRPHYLLASVALTLAGGGSSVLNLFCTRIRSMKSVGIGQVFSRFSGRL